MALFQSTCLETMTDEELILHYQKRNDTAAFEVLYQRYSHLVFCVCQKYLQNVEESKDTVMEIFARLLRDLKRYQITFFKGWIYTFTKNHCLMKIRKSGLRKKYIQVADELDPAQGKDEFDTLLEATPFEIRNLRSALKQLNPAQNSCVQLFYLEKKSYREISKITGYSIRQVKSYLQNGKRNLKIILKQAGDYHDE
jgi:RNA polymerase sigma-70 factor (ECF subfamily)